MAANPQTEIMERLSALTKGKAQGRRNANARQLLLDAGVLGQASHPRRNPAFAQGFDRLLTTETVVMIIGS